VVAGSLRQQAEEKEQMKRARQREANADEENGFSSSRNQRRPLFSTASRRTFTPAHHRRP